MSSPRLALATRVMTHDRSGDVLYATPPLPRPHLKTLPNQLVAYALLSLAARSIGSGAPSERKFARAHREHCAACAALSCVQGRCNSAPSFF